MLILRSGKEPTLILRFDKEPMLILRFDEGPNAKFDEKLLMQYIVNFDVIKVKEIE